MIYGYVRVSTPNQKDGNSIQDQKSKILERYPDAKIVVEVYSGAKERPLFSKLLQQVKQGDTIVTTKLDRFCRSTQDGLDYIADCQSRNVNIHILNMGLIEDSPIGKLIVTQLLAFAEYERAIIKERTAAGKLIAKQKPDYKEGRPKLEVPDFEETKAKVDNNEISLKSALVALGISKSTYYRLIK